MLGRRVFQTADNYELHEENCGGTSGVIKNGAGTAAMDQTGLMVNARFNVTTAQFLSFSRCGFGQMDLLQLFDWLKLTFEG